MKGQTPTSILPFLKEHSNQKIDEGKFHFIQVFWLMNEKKTDRIRTSPFYHPNEELNVMLEVAIAPALAHSLCSLLPAATESQP